MPPLDRSISPIHDVVDTVRRSSSPMSSSSASSRSSSSRSSSSRSSSSRSSSESEHVLRIASYSMNSSPSFVPKESHTTTSSSSGGSGSGGGGGIGFLATSRRLAAAASSKLQEQVGQYKEHRNVLSNLESSLQTLLTLLERKGVATSCIQELRKQIKSHNSNSVSTNNNNSNNSNNSNNNNSNSPNNSSNTSNSTNNSKSVCLVYVHVLERCQQYAECVIASMTTTVPTTVPKGSSNGSSKNTILSHAIDIESMNQMIITCWSQLCSYISYQYKHAYKAYHTLRDKINERKQYELEQIQRQLGIIPSGTIVSSSSSISVLSCSDDFVGSEYNTVQHHGSIQNQYIQQPYETHQFQHVEHQQQRHQPTSTSSSSSPSANIGKYFHQPPEIQLQRALKYQIQLAEECCTVQKGLILAQAVERKQRQQFQRIRKQYQLQLQQQQAQ